MVGLHESLAHAREMTEYEVDRIMLKNSGFVDIPRTVKYHTFGSKALACGMNLPTRKRNYLQYRGVILCRHPTSEDLTIFSCGGLLVAIPYDGPLTTDCVHELYVSGT